MGRAIEGVAKGAQEQAKAICKTLGEPFERGRVVMGGVVKANGRAKSLAAEEGLTKVIAHAETDRLLGIHIVGARASDMIAEAVLALEFGGINMLAPATDAPVSASALIVTYAAGMLVSLPLTFVPFAALFDGAPLRAAVAEMRAHRFPSW